MAASTQGLARRPHSTLDTVQEALTALAARYRGDEVLTSIKHIPAREAQFAAMPDWVRPELAAAYRAKGIDRLYSHQAGCGRARPRRKRFRGRHSDGVRQNALLQPAGPERRAGKSRHARALPLPHQGARAGSARRAARSGDSGSTIASASSPTTATRPPTRARPFASAATSCSPIPTCCTPASCRTTRKLARACSKICATSCSTNCTPIAASSAAIWPTCCGGCGASRDSTARTRNSSAASATIANPGELAARLAETRIRE